jgi:hypothetical protein
MRTTLYLGFLFLFSFASPTISLAGQPSRQILGLRLNMTGKEAHARLKQIGSFVRPDALKQEVWKVHDPSYSNILLGFTKDDRLRYITAVARSDKEAKPVAYASIGNLKDAKNAGDSKMKLYNYQWHLSATKEEPETLVIAIGRDPARLSTYSLKRVSKDAGAEDNE